MFLLGLALLTAGASCGPFDAAPFAIRIEHGRGIQWEDPREVHRVVVRFAGPAPKPETLRLEYWTSRWPEQRLPKDRQPGGGDVGWWELGNWYTGAWKRADAEATVDGSSVAFTFRPANEHEFPKMAGFNATFRYTLKLRIASDETLPAVESLAGYTDSTTVERAVRLAWREPRKGPVTAQAFNGRVLGIEPRADGTTLRFVASANPDPNTFDRTLITVRAGNSAFTFAADDLVNGPILAPSAGVAVLPAEDRRTYAAVEKAQVKPGASLYTKVGERPEQTWRKAWAFMPPKKSRIYYPLGLDGGRQRFQLNADGSLLLRTNDHYLRGRPGKDTPRLELEAGPVRFRFNLPDQPVGRELLEKSLPVCRTRWERDGISILQTAFVTPLEGTKPEAGAPPGDTTTVFVARFELTNKTDGAKAAVLSLKREPEENRRALLLDSGGLLWDGQYLRGQAVTDGAASVDDKRVRWSWNLAPGETRTLVLKLPYVLLTEPAERESLAHLDFEHERTAVAAFWRRQMDRSARLITPEPMLNGFYRAHASHLLINCELEPGSDRRFARVGSFGYGAYGNESCMMVVDLDRRGYHDEARECLDAWLHYQSTVALPGAFSSKEGVLYGAGGYEAGGYNQHHGWILWCLAEHYRFTRDDAWLRKSAPGVLAAAEWIMKERARTLVRTDLAKGLLPPGSLEDIQDWWPWLSTNCYTWRGLDSAAWALEQIDYPQAAEVRKQADDYHRALLAAFRAAALRSPVVRLRDGTSVPHFPSHVFRRGRTFGWICETLEGALHLLITRALDAKSPEARWILNDYEDNLYLSNQYGYTIPDFDRNWFGLGGMSMQACLLFDVEPYLYRDDVKQALRSMFNGIAVGYFPDVQMLTEHSLPNPGDWRGDHFKSSDESNAAGWLRYLFVREEGDTLLLGQAIPREWLKPGSRCGIERTATYFGPASVVYEAAKDRITAHVEGPTRNPPKWIRVRFRAPSEKPPKSVTVNGKPVKTEGDWVQLPGNVGKAEVVATW
jgi:hypothetical protein